MFYCIFLLIGLTVKQGLINPINQSLCLSSYSMQLSTLALAITDGWITTTVAI